MAEALKRNDARSEERYQGSQSSWDKIADSKEFKDSDGDQENVHCSGIYFLRRLLFCVARARRLCAGQFMSTKVLGVNLAYLFALSQFFVAWLIAGLYVKAANGFDRLAKDIVEKAEIVKGGK